MRLEKYIITLLLCVATIVTIHAQTSIYLKEVTVTTPGTIKTVLGMRPDTIVALKVNGEINSTDFITIRKLCGYDKYQSPTIVDCNLRILDLSDAHIREGGEGFDILGYFGTADNVVSRDLFSYCWGLVYLELPRDITKIEDTAFQSCVNLYYVGIPEGVIEIDDWAFADCENLEEIKLPSSLRKIGEKVFTHNFALKEMDIPDQIEEVGYGLFYACRSLERVHLPERRSTSSG